MTPQKEATAEPFHSTEVIVTSKCKELGKKKVQRAKDEERKVKEEVKGEWKWREK